MNKFTAMQDPTNLDFMPWRVNMKTDNGARMLCRCDSQEDAGMIVRALVGTYTVVEENTVTASRDGEVLKEIESALALIREAKAPNTNESKTSSSKMRIVL